MFEYSKEFVCKLAEKDTEAFNKFYLDSIDIFYRYLKWNYFFQESDIQDLLSILYFRIWNWLDGFKENVNFKSWVWTILKNLIIDQMKKNKEIQFSSIWWDESENYIESLESNDNLLDILDKDYRYEQIINAMEQIEEKYKEVIFLKLVEEKTYDEISIIINESNSNVRKRFERWLKKLKEILGVY